MSFIDIRLPVEITRKFSGGPTFSTMVVGLVSGKEQRNINWQNARAKYSASTKNLNNIDAKKLLEIFFVCRGRAHSFRFKDWLDFEAISQTIGTGDGNKKDFYLSKTYNVNGSSYSRQISKPVSGTVKLYLNNVLTSTGFTIDHSSGKVSFTTAPAAAVSIKADFQFDVPVRFTEDQLSINNDPGLSNSVKEINLIEVK